LKKETHDLEKEENLVLKELNRLHERFDKLEAEIKKHSK
jgi:hypothetical protein